MANYIYTVINKEGKQLKGNLEADTKELAELQLRNQELTIVGLSEASVMNQQISFNIGGKPKARDMSVFCRQFVSIVDAGVPVITALNMLGEQTENKMLREAILGCKLSIEKGTTLADAMMDYPKVFDRIFVTMVRAGEESGSLSKSFDRMGVQYEKQHQLNALVRKTSIYPTILILVTIGVVIVMLRVVVPQYKDMLSDLDAELPAITKFVMGLSEGLGDYWMILLGIVVLLIVGIRQMAKGESGAVALSKLQLKIPMLGKLVQKQNSASFTRTLATLLASGIPMIDALNIAGGTLKNLLFVQAVEHARDSVSMGSNLSLPLKESGQFPPLVYQMISIGEDTGNIDGMLDKVADYYDEEVKEATEQLMAMLEPAIIIALAVVVGTIVLSVIMPMSSMYEALDNV